MTAASTISAGVLEECRQQLQDGRSLMRQAALARLMATAGDADLSPLFQDIRICLEDPDEEVRQMAVAVLLKAGGTAAGFLVSATRPPQPINVRMAAVVALGQLKTEAQAAIEAMIECLGDDDRVLRTNAALALSRIGAPAVPRLVACLAAGDENVQIGAMDALGWMGPVARAAVEDLKAIAAKLELSARLADYGALVKITGHAAEGLPMLLAQLDHPQAAVRQTCIERMGELREKAAEAFAAIQPCLQDASGAIRAAAALALVRIKTQCPEAVEALIALLQDPDQNARINAAIALATIGPPAQAALRALKNLTGDPDERLCGIAAAAIQSIEGRPPSSKDDFRSEEG
jgi:HEAT repeat protein